MLTRERHRAHDVQGEAEELGHFPLENRMLRRDLGALCNHMLRGQKDTLFSG